MKALRWAELQDRIFKRRLVEQMISDRKRWEQVEAVARDHASDSSGLETEVAGNPGTKDAALIFVDYAANSAEGIKALGTVADGWRQKDLKSPHARAQTRARRYVLPALLVLIVVAWVVLNDPVETHIALWRLTKSGNSELDVQRNARRLIDGARRSSLQARMDVRDQLGERLIDPRLGASTAEEVLKVLLAIRGEPGHPSFARTFDVLADCLRSRSVDVRARVHQALTFVVGEASGTNALPVGLRDWKPLSTHSAVDLEAVRDQWLACRREILRGQRDGSSNQP
jgi:hypothetical protein